MKRIATTAVLVFALAGARGVLAQMGFRDWNAATLDSPSERDSGSDYSGLIPDYTIGIKAGSRSVRKSYWAPYNDQVTTGWTGAQPVTASAEIPAQEDPTPGEDFFAPWTGLDCASNRVLPQFYSPHVRMFSQSLGTTFT